MTGIVIVDKPAGWTSFDVAAKLRSVFHERRVGHGGTLDPMATGVLPLFLGRATRALPYFEEFADKEYIAGLRLGLETDTEDTTGQTLAEYPVQVQPEQVCAAVEALTGTQMQTPPMYSAIRINGQRLYELARQGKTVERPARPVTIYEAELLSGAGRDYVFRVRCSKGTYVRTLCAQIGRSLGCGGCMSSLRRSAAGCYRLEQAVPMEQLLGSDPAAHVLPLDTLFASYPAVQISPEAERRLRNGNPIPGEGLEGRCRVYGADGSFLALGQMETGRIVTVKSFFEV